MNINRANNAPAFKAIIRVAITDDKQFEIIKEKFANKASADDTFKFKIFSDDRITVNNQPIKKIATGSDVDILSNIKAGISDVKKGFSMVFFDKDIVRAIKNGQFDLKNLLFLVKPATRIARVK